MKRGNWWKDRLKIFEYFKSPKNIVKFLLCAIVFFGIVYLNESLSLYVQSISAPPLQDFLHNTLPFVNLSMVTSIFFNVLKALFIILIVFYEPKKFNPVIITFALFLLVRSLFFSMTSLGAPVTMFNLDYTFLFHASQNMTQDLFPSGHVGVTFLMALFISNKKISRFYIASAIVIGLFLLMMHAHYSIDVFGAFFVSFGVFYFTRKYIWKHVEFK